MYAFFEKLGQNFIDPGWWAGEFPSWLVFTVGVGVVATIMERRRYSRERQAFENWNLRVIGFGDADQKLYFEDVRRFMSSDFEMWKFAKSVVSGACEVKLRSIEQARGWISIDKENRLITIDLLKIPDEHVEKWRGVNPKTPIAAPAGERAVA